MNSVLEGILSSGQVTDGRETVPLNANMDAREGALLSRVFETVRPTTSLEVGFAYGISTLFICDALETFNKPARHIAVDPFQYSQWKGIGFRNIKQAGYEKFLDLREEKSEIALPQLLAENTVLDAALIDGWHTFDHALVDFFFINKMLRVGGVVIFDDASWPAIGKLIDHTLSYGCYRVFGIPDRSVRFLRPRTFLFLRKLLFYCGLRKSKWPSAVALEKIAVDNRNWDWFKPF
jgi:predicted O-methyltransferase YrrM